MALSRRALGSTSRVLGRCYPYQPRASTRSFSSLKRVPGAIYTARSPNASVYFSKRPFSSSGRLLITGQEAPDAKAYIASGVIAESKNRADVKKVLVIGSGGLSIGQAGEFDYSGESCSVMWACVRMFYPICAGG